MEAGGQRGMPWQGSRGCTLQESWGSRDTRCGHVCSERGAAPRHLRSAVCWAAGLLPLPLPEDRPGGAGVLGNGTHPRWNRSGGGGCVCAPHSQTGVTHVLCRWNQAHKSSGTTFQGLPSKVDTLKEEMDEAGNKVEQCKVRWPRRWLAWFWQRRGERSNVTSY